MSSPEEAAPESGIGARSTPDPSHDCERAGNLSILDNVAVPGGAKDPAVDSKKTNISGVTFGDFDSTPTTTTERRKVKRKDVEQIFRATTTTGAVNAEQIQRINQMHDKIADGAEFDFNYYCLLVVASVVAGLGLATNSSTTVISSMLLSPIMGPVVGISYGLCIWDLPLIKRSIRNEIISIAICVFLGLLIGVCTHWTPMADEWPTDEMLSRGTRSTFLTGIPIAFFSGLGVALSVLDDSTSSLVGVAISASLLPPAVNCGMLLIVAWLKGDSWSDFSFEYNPHPILHEIHDKRVEGAYNFSQVGLMSLFLTVANVIMVAIGASLMFRVKEVLPVKKKVFWNDLKIARRLYQGRALDQTTGEVLDPSVCARMA